MKFITISLIVIGLIIVFNLGGVTTPVGGYAMRFFGDLDSDTSPLLDFKDDPLVWLGLIAVAGLVGLVGARAGLFGSAPPINYYLGTLIVVTLGGFVLTDMLTIFGLLWTTGEDWIRAIALLIFIPLTFAYISALKSFWEGTD